MLLHQHYMLTNTTHTHTQTDAEVLSRILPLGEQAEVCKHKLSAKTVLVQEAMFGGEVSILSTSFPCLHHYIDPEHILTILGTLYGTNCPAFATSRNVSCSYDFTWPACNKERDYAIRWYNLLTSAPSTIQSLNFAAWNISCACEQVILILS